MVGRHIFLHKYLVCTKLIGTHSRFDWSIVYPMVEDSPCPSLPLLWPPPSPSSWCRRLHSQLFASSPVSYTTVPKMLLMPYVHFYAGESLTLLPGTTPSLHNCSLQVTVMFPMAKEFPFFNTCCLWELFSPNHCDDPPDQRNSISETCCLWAILFPHSDLVGYQNFHCLRPYCCKNVDDWVGEKRLVFQG